MFTHRWFGRILTLCVCAATAWLPVDAVAGLFDTWSHSSQITINYREYEPVSNITVLVTLGTHIPGFSYTQFARGDGYDLRFEDGTGAELSYEIDTWNPSGTSYVWVRLPVLRGNGTTSFFDGQWVFNMPWEGGPVFAHYYNSQLYAEGAGYNGAWNFNMGEGLANVGYYNRLAMKFAKTDPRTNPSTRLSPNYTDGQIFHTWSGGLYGLTNPITMTVGSKSVRARYVNGDLYAEWHWNDGNDPWDLCVYEHLMQSGCDPTSPSGYDISARFANYDAVQCWAGNTSAVNYYKDFRPAHYDGVWVNTNSALPFIKAYWGNASAAQQVYTTNGGAWSSAYGGVWHMNDAAAKDSNKGVADGVPNAVSVASGKLGSGLQFANVSTSYVNLGTANLALGANKGYSIEGWIRKSANNGSGSDVAVSYGGGTIRQVASMGTASGTYKSLHAGQDHSFPNTVPLGQWQHFVITHYASGQGDDPVNGGDSYTDQLWINGQVVGWRGNAADGNGPTHNTATVLALPTSAPLFFGKASWESGTCGDMILDEVRIHNKSQQANAIKISYLSQASNTTFMTYGAVAGGTPTVSLFPSNTTWRYYDVATDPGTTWKDRTYTDSAWQVGQALLGYGDADIVTTLSDGNVPGAKLATYYFRKHFTVADRTQVEWLSLTGAFDDGAIVYVNGVELSPRMIFASTSVVTHTTYTAQNVVDESVWTSMSVPVSALVNGDNVIAVEVHQAGPTSSDVRFHMYADYGGGTLTSINDASTGTTSTNIQAPVAPSNWTAYNDASWQGDDVIGITSAYTTFSPGGTASGTLVSDAGQPLTGTTVSMATNASTFSFYALGSTNLTWPVGTDAANEFEGRIGRGYACEIQGVDAVVTVTLGGLKTNKQYKLVVWSSRLANFNNYSNRYTDVILSGMDSFVNTSTIDDGVSRFATAVTDDSTTIRSVLRDGYAPVVRFEQIRPGTDGSVEFRVKRNASSVGNAYFNAFKLVESDITVMAGDADTDGMPDSWEQQYFGGTSVLPGSDADADGISNIQEYILNTNPNTGNSRPELGGAASTNGNLGLNLGTTVTQRLYYVDYKTNLTSATWQPAMVVTGDGSQLSISVSNVVDKFRYYRLRIRMMP